MTNPGPNRERRRCNRAAATFLRVERGEIATRSSAADDDCEIDRRVAESMQRRCDLDRRLRSLDEARFEDDREGETAAFELTGEVVVAL